jgi:hypothetical protein
LKMSCWYGLILHNEIIFKIMFNTWQSLENWLRYGLQNTPFSQVFGYNYFEKTLYFKREVRGLLSEWKALETAMYLLFYLAIVAYLNQLTEVIQSLKIFH